MERRTTQSPMILRVLGKSLKKMSWKRKDTMMLAELLARVITCASSTFRAKMERTWSRVPATPTSSVPHLATPSEY